MPEKQEPASHELQHIVSLYNQGKIQESLDQTRQLLKSFPSSATLYNISGKAFLKLRKFENAIESFDKLISIKPDFHDAYRSMASAFAESGNTDEAIINYKKATKISPDDFFSHFKTV